MQATIEPTRTQHPLHIFLLMEKRTSQGRVAAKKQGGHERNRHHFGIREMALGIIMMAQGQEHIGSQAVDCYNVPVHEEVLLSTRFGTITLALLHGYLVGGNLGYLVVRQ